ncbi:MAG: alpha-glucuronidase, partial [Planctomycetes bacterium]|nr:alpha-glucuronidase [Planctomycetota bacterium]
MPMVPRIDFPIRPLLVALLTALTLGPGVQVNAETGHDLWLRYGRVENAKQRDIYRRAVSSIVASSSSPTARLIVAELQRGLRGLLGVDLPMSGAVNADGAIVIGTPATSPLIASLGWSERLARIGDEGYLLRSATLGGRTVTVIASRGE